MDTDKYPHIQTWQWEIVARYGEHLNSTGGNAPLDLLNDFQRPNNRDLSVNLPRYLLGFGLHTQVGLLATLEAQGLVKEKA
jgi:hypothetical protein